MCACCGYNSLPHLILQRLKAEWVVRVCYHVVVISVCAHAHLLLLCVVDVNAAGTAWLAMVELVGVCGTGGFCTGFWLQGCALPGLVAQARSLPMQSDAVVKILPLLGYRYASFCNMLCW
jgi:hypothetical protein